MDGGRVVAGVGVEVEGPQRLLSGGAVTTGSGLMSGGEWAGSHSCRNVTVAGPGVPGQSGDRWFVFGLRGLAALRRDRVLQVTDDLVPDDLRERVAPLLPPRPPRRPRYPGRLPADDRAALRGIVYVLRTGVTWAAVPTETIGRGGVMTPATPAGPDRGRLLAPPARDPPRGTPQDGTAGVGRRRGQGGSHRTFRRSTVAAGAPARVRRVVGRRRHAPAPGPGCARGRAGSKRATKWASSRDCAWFRRGSQAVS